MFDSVWLSVITLTTVGYGDVYALTFTGRLFTMILALWGATLISLLVVIFSGIFELDKHQKMALNQIKLSQSASNTIKSSIEYFKAKRQNRMIRLKKGIITSYKDDHFLKMLYPNKDLVDNQSAS